MFMNRFESRTAIQGRHIATHSLPADEYTLNQGQTDTIASELARIFEKIPFAVSRINKGWVTRLLLHVVLQSMPSSLSPPLCTYDKIIYLKTRSTGQPPATAGSEGKQQIRTLLYIVVDVTAARQNFPDNLREEGKRCRIEINPLALKGDATIPIVSSNVRDCKMITRDIKRKLNLSSIRVRLSRIKCKTWRRR